MQTVNRIKSLERRRVKPNIVIGFEHADGKLYTEPQWSNIPGKPLGSLAPSTRLIRIVYVNDWGQHDS